MRDDFARDDFVQRGTDDASAVTLTAAEERLINKKKDAEAKRLKRRKEKLEKDIEKEEQKIEEVQQEMCLPEVLSDPEKLNALSVDLDEAKKKLDEMYDEWMTLE